ncbi:Uncharacterized protein QTN25_001556 [Entamoeba marina]
MFCLVFLILCLFTFVSANDFYEFNDELDDFFDTEFALDDAEEFEDIDDDYDDDDDEYLLQSDISTTNALVQDVERTLAQMASFPYSNEFM